MKIEVSCYYDWVVLWQVGVVEAVQGTLLLQSWVVVDVDQCGARLVILVNV